MIARAVGLLSLLFLLLPGLFTIAQGPILPGGPTLPPPWYGDHGPTLPPPWYLPTNPPTRPTITPYPPSPTPNGQYRAYVQALALLYRWPAELANPVMYLTVGETPLAHDIDANWACIDSGWARGYYVESWTLRRTV